MTVEQNKAIVRQLLETAWNTGNLSPMEAHPGLHEIMPTMQQVKDSGAKPTIMETFGEGEWVAVRMLTDLPPTLNIPGMPGAGGKMEVIQMFRVVDGIIVKQHSQAGRIE